MPKVAWSTPIENTSDATYRAWGLDISTRLATSGLVQMPDTGQVNWATVTRPAASTYNARENWRFDDALQASSPVCITIEYGCSNNQTTPAIRVTVSSGTNGAGVPTGLVSTAIVNYASGLLVANANITNFPSRIVHTAGFFALVFKIGAGVSGLTLFSFLVERTTNNVGIPTPDAVVFIACGNGNQATLAAPASIINYVTSSVNTAVTGEDIGFMASRITSSVVAAGPQMFHHWVCIPQMLPLVGSGAYILSEEAVLSEHDLVMVGTAPRRYLCVGNALRKTAYNGGGAVLGTAILWED